MLQKTRCNWKSSAGVTVLSAALVGLLLIGVVPAEARQSGSASAQSQDFSSIGNLRFQASTTQQDCSDRTTQVSGWINGQVTDCLEPEDSYDAQGNCFAQNGSGNAALQAGATACGAWDGKSNHKYVQGGSTTTIQTGRTTSMYAGSCEEVACIALWPDWSWNGNECVFTPGSPIIVSINKSSAYKLTSAEDGVLFDIDADGVVDRVAWTEADSDVAFLAIDRDGDGRITSGRELFGNYTIPGASNGFEALRKMAMATNGGIARGSVSSDDPLYAQLLLWTDRNHNGISEEDELQAASEVVSDVGLGYYVTGRKDHFGNDFRYRGWVHIRTGKQGRNAVESPEENRLRTRQVWDVYLTMAR